MSSISGRISFPCNSPYCLTKYAVEAMSDSLRHEMYKWDVKVVLVEPANFAGERRLPAPEPPVARTKIFAYFYGKFVAAGTPRIFWKRTFK